LQEREFERLGSPRTKKLDVRVVAATHRGLEEMMLKRQFRSDLYYKLNVVPISIPALRERPEDIPFLVLHFVRQFAGEMGKTIDAIRPDAMHALRHQSAVISPRQRIQSRKNPDTECNSDCTRIASRFSPRFCEDPRPTTC
jgi:DNA-binding NtrC family response regulator